MEKVNKFKISLRARLYWSMIAIIMFSFIITGLLAVYHGFEQNEVFNTQRLARKENAIERSLEYFLEQEGGTINRDSLVYEFSDKICELSDVHNLFIVMYSLDGRYEISTNSSRMDSLGLPYQMDYTALKQLSTGNQRTVVEKEINDVKYSMVYWYFKGQNGAPIAITNVVYENMDTDDNFVSDFLKELGAVYIALFLMAAFSAFLLSRYIVRSLDTIGKKMKQMKLGGQNEMLNWASNDEIGALVSEYNRMVAELEKSATKLAVRERESAWRDMARQVAHEIKNPLTPMKLRVQHLQRTWQENPGDFDQRLELFSGSMIEQIDTLANIASEFSNFANLPEPKREQLNIVQIVKGVLELYSEVPDVRFNVRTYGHSQIMINADKDQVIRVCNNLINNAVQALPNGQCGIIDIAIRPSEMGVVLRFSDNGIGIDEASRAKIFVPNFTTKSTGSGLGLVMVKNIMERNNGDVGFWSKAGKGASFYLLFKKDSSLLKD
jgi:two-component system, NtrC family, nitrogen regulation sensor histidine kinase NtrY